MQGWIDYNLKLSIRQVPLSFPDLRCGMLVKVCHGFRGASGIASFLNCECVHGAFAQSFDVIQETGGGQNVWRPWIKSKKSKTSEVTNNFLQAPGGRANQRQMMISSVIWSYRWWPRKILQPGWPHKQSASQRSRSLQEQRWWGGSLSDGHPGLFCFSVERCRPDETI